MNASAPGWQPDPSGRHEYRYWDGGTWTEDVADAGVTAVDPLPGGPPPGGPAPSGSPVPSGDPTAIVDPTQGYAPTAAYGTPTPGRPGGYPPADAGGAPGGPGGYGPTAGYPAYGSGPVPPVKAPRSGPSTGLLVGLGALALALIVAIVVVLTGDDGDSDETSTSDTSASVTTEADGDTTDTSVGDDDSTTDTSIDLGSGDIDFDDPEVRAAIVDVVADQLEGSGFSREQAECFTNAMLDGLGADRLAEIGASGGDMSSLTPEDMSSVFDAVADCGVTLPDGTGG